jgi:hypothetical protein
MIGDARVEPSFGSDLWFVAAQKFKLSLSLSRKRSPVLIEGATDMVVVKRLSKADDSFDAIQLMINFSNTYRTSMASQVLEGTLKSKNPRIAERFASCSI